MKKNPSFTGAPIVLSSPSGGGKSTIATLLLKKISHLTRSVSWTTRNSRPYEKKGRDYFFTEPGDFKKRVRRGEFLEWAKVHDNWYGTPKALFDRELRRGQDVLLVIDPQGAKSIRKKYPKGIFIFILPPSWNELRKRLTYRGESKQTLTTRLQNARREIKSLSHYDYVVVNHRLEAAVTAIAAIIEAERYRRHRVNLHRFSLLLKVRSR